MSLDLRDGVVKRDHGTGDDGDVHDVPVVSHVGTWVKDEATVENLFANIFVQHFIYIME